MTARSFLQNSLSIRFSAIGLTWMGRARRGHAVLCSRHCRHLVVINTVYIAAMPYDPATIAILRQALDEVLLDRRFHRPGSTSALEIAEHLLAQAAAGERNLENLKSSAFAKLLPRTQRFPDQAA